MFHEVPCAMSETIEEENFSISANSFRNLLQGLLERNMSFCSLSELLSSSNSLSPRVAITFDDIYASVVQNAVPVLNEFQIPFTLFISASYIDTPNYIRSEEIRALSQNPYCEIGYHTATHSKMRSLKNDIAVFEQTNSDIFSKTYGICCRYFAYPYGSVYMCPKRVQKAVARMGYDAAFGTIHSGTNAKMIEKHRFYIPRLNVNETNADDILKIIK